MAGIYQEGTSKVLSGVYSLIQSSLEVVEMGGRGVIAYPFLSDWGPINTLDTILTANEFRTKYNGHRTTLSARLVQELAFKGKPQRLLTYRMASADAKKGEATLNDNAAGVALVLETRYPSDRAFVAAVKTGLVSGVTVEILEGTVLHAKVDADTLDELVEKLNGTTVVRVKTKGTNLPTVTAGVPFAGGNNGVSVTVNEYEAFLTAILADGTANAFAFPGITDEAILTTATTWLKEVRDEGFYTAFVRGGAKAWDNDLSLANAVSKQMNQRYLHNVGNGADGYSAAEIATFIAARVGSVPLNRTITDEVVDFKELNNVTAVTPGERVKAKEAGTIIFVKKGDVIEIDEGVNTLTTPHAGEVKEYGKIRVSNALDHIAKDLEKFGDEYKKDKSNTPEARETYAATVENTYLRGLVGMEVLQDGAWYRPDPEYHGDAAIYNPKIDEAFFHADITPVDSMERLYQKIGVSFNK
jgi:hypothetical protein